MNKISKKSLNKITAILSLILSTTSIVLIFWITISKEMLNSASINTPTSSAITLAVDVNTNGDLVLRGDKLPEIKNTKSYENRSSNDVYEEALGKIETSSNLLVVIIENRDKTITEIVYEINRIYTVDIVDNKYIQRINSVGDGNIVVLLSSPPLEIFITPLPSEISACQSAIKTPIAIEEKVYVCIPDSLNLRTAPDLNADVIKRLTPGTTFTVIEGPTCSNTSNWWKVRTIDGFSGWVKEGDENEAYICPVLAIPEIIIGDWKINQAKCQNFTRPWVEILGVEILGGEPPYLIDFYQRGIHISSEKIFIESNEINSTLIFKRPILVETGSYITVTIKSNTQDGKPSWQDTLYFPYLDPACASNE